MCKISEIVPIHNDGQSTSIQLRTDQFPVDRVKNILNTNLQQQAVPTHPNYPPCHMDSGSNYPVTYLIEYLHQIFLNNDPPDCSCPRHFYVEFQKAFEKVRRETFSEEKLLSLAYRNASLN